MPKCGNCGTGHADDIQFCTQCGEVMPQKTVGGKVAPEDVGGAFDKLASEDMIGAAFSTKSKVEHSPSPSATASTASRADRLNARAKVVKTVARAAAIGIAKSIALSVAVLGPGFVMLIMGMTVAGMAWLFVGSFGMMAWSYRKPWRLGALACLIPPVAAALCYVLQLLIFGAVVPPIAFLAGAVVAGLFVGFWRAQTHEVKRDDAGGIIAERTIGYLLVWAVAYGATQFLGLVAISELAIRAGLITGAFTTAMLATVSFVVWRQFKRFKAAPIALIFAVLVGLGGGFLPEDAHADEATLDLMKRLAGTSTNPAALADAMPPGTQVLSRKFASIEGTNEYSGAQMEILIAKGLQGEGMLSAAQLIKQANVSVEDFIQRVITNQSTEAASCGVGRAYLSVGDDGTTISVAAEAHGKALIIQTTESYHIPKAERFGETVLQRVALATCRMFAGNQAGDDVGNALGSTAAPVNPQPSAGSGGDASTRGGDDQPDRPTRPTNAAKPGIDSVEAAATASAIAMVLVAAGIGANAAQAIAAAVANSLQAGVQLTAEEMQQAIADALRDLVGRGNEATSAKDNNAPPNVTSSERVKPPSQSDETASQTAPRETVKPEEPEADVPTEESEAETPAKGETPASEGEAPAGEPDTSEKTPQKSAAKPEVDEDKTSPHEPQRPHRDPSFAEPGVDNSSTGWMTNFLGEFVGGVGKDSWDLVTQAPGALWEAGKTALKTAGDALSDRENWKIGLDTLSETGKDVGALARGDLERIEKVGKNLGEGAKAGLKIAEHLKNEIEKDPAGAVVGAAKVVLGAESWGKAVDPNVPVTERFGRAVWGVIDTGGTVVGLGGAATKGAGKLSGLMRTSDAAGDAASALRAADKLGDATAAARAADASGDAATALNAADKAGDTATAVRTTDAAGDGVFAARVVDNAEDGADAARVGDAALDAEKAEGAAHKTSDATRQAGLRTGETDPVAPQSLDELRERLASQKRGHTERGADFVPGKNTEVHGLPDPKRDPAGYVQNLPEGALVDQNLATAGTGWTGHQIDDMGRFAKNENVSVGARTTNLDSMRHIRDGKAVPKPLDIKSKTIGDLDVYLGAKSDDKGLVGYFRPQKPKLDDVPSHLRKQVNDRFKLRMDEYNDYRDDVNKLVSEGKVVERNGKLHAVVKDSSGKAKHVPYAGDVDGVYFRDLETNKMVPPGERYDRLKDAWMGGNKEKGVPNYWTGSNAPGQHGVETNLVADLTAGKVPGTPEYDDALKKARKLHAKLGKSYPKEVIVEVDAVGNVRRGLHLSAESQPLSDLTKGI